MAGVALVGATAMAVTPIAPTIHPPALFAASPAVSTEVSLAASVGYANPFTAALGTLNLVNTNLWDSHSEDILPETIDLYQGIVPQFIYDALPILTRLGYNGSGSIGSTFSSILTGPNSSAVILSDAVWNLPGALVLASQQALAGDIPAAVATLNAAIVAPVQQAGATALAAGSAVFNGILTNLSNVVAILPNLATGLVNTTVGAVQLELAKAIQVGTAFVAAVTSLNPEAAWNVAVDGLLGPNGLPGLTEQLTIGGGVQTPIGEGDPPPNAYHASFRVWANNAVYEIANALGSDFTTIDLATNPVTASAVPAVAASAALAAAPSPATAKVAKVLAAAPATEASSVDASSAGASSADDSTPKPADTTSDVSTPKPVKTTSDVSTPKPVKTTSDVSTPKPVKSTSDVSTPKPVKSTSDVSTPKPVKSTSDSTPKPTKDKGDAKPAKSADKAGSSAD